MKNFLSVAAASAQLLSAKAIMVEEEEMEMEVFNGEEHQERPSDEGDESEVQEDKDSLLTPDHDDTAITQSTSIKSKIKLRRELNLLTTVMIIVGHIIGSGIFITPTRVLQLSGSFGLALILWTLGGFISLLGGLTYVELTTFIKNSGAEYAFLKEAYSFNGKHAITRVIGNLVGYLFFWMYSLVGTPASNAVISLTFGRYLSQALNGGNSPPVLAVKILAISAILFGVLINLYSLKATALFINVTSFSKILALIFISILGIWQLIKGDHLNNFTESFKDTNPCAGEVVLAFYSILYSYSGWYVI
jgi:amino acid transporter